MPVYEIDPLEDPRWGKFVDDHPQSCPFHTTGWQKALHISYGYQPFAVTTAKPGEVLRDGIVLCKVRSWLTGRRIVSLPFSDHCQPLVDDAATMAILLSYLRSSQEAGHWRYVELRPLAFDSPGMPSESGFARSTTYCFHVLDLRPGLEEIFRDFHRNSVRQMVNRANREKLTITEGRSENILRIFYGLLLLTRRRHELPPQPFTWFRNLADCMGDKVMVRIALKNGAPIASILTLSHNRTVIYKYGCSDAAYHNLGGMPFLFWRAIQDAKRDGAEWFDFGRSELDNSGLIAFKDHWGGQSSQLTYYRFPMNSINRAEGLSRMPILRKAFSYLPDYCLSVAGTLLYKHIG